MAIISVTMGSHSGAETMVEHIASTLGLRSASREVLIEAAKTFNVPEGKVAQVFEKTPSFWERMTESRRTYLAYIQAQLAEWTRDDNLIYHGNAGQELLRDIPHVLKVRVIVPWEKRLALTMEHMKFSREHAERYVEELDESRTRRMRYLFNADWRDPARFDLVINLERIAPEHAEQMIVDLSRHAEFQLQEHQRAKFNDFHIRCRVYAMLAGALVGRLSLVTVTVQEGVVTLQGTLTSHESMIEPIVEDIRNMEGVSAVNNEIVVGLVYHEWNV